MPELTLTNLDALRDTLKETAKDVRLNVGNALASERLSAEQAWGIALASAFFLGEPRLRDALVADAKAGGASDDLIEDAQAAASLMGMNTIFYRFRHLVGKPGYATKPAGLRMQWMTRPKTGKAMFELCCMGPAVLAGCEVCIKAHEASLLKEGLNEDQILDAVRIAAVLQGLVVSLKL